VTILKGAKVLGTSRAYSSNEVNLESTPLAAGGYSVNAPQ
jgi:hypothetical protein